MKAAAHEINAEFEDEYWWYVGRRRIILEVLASHLHCDGAPKARLLDAGCGTGAMLKAVDGLTEAVGTDASTVALSWCKRRGLGGRVACCDFAAPPFRDGTFDVVMLLDVLEHLDDDKGALKNAFRLLQGGGLLVVTVPAYPILWSGEDYVSEHRRRYVRRDVQEMVAAAGFTVQQSSYFNAILFPVMAATILWRRFFVPEDRVRSNVRPLPIALNLILTAVFTLERSLLRWMSFPCGGSILCVAVKKEPA